MAAMSDEWEDTMCFWPVTMEGSSRYAGSEACPDQFHTIFQGNNTIPQTVGHMNVAVSISTKKRSIKRMYL